MPGSQAISVLSILLVCPVSRVPFWKSSQHQLKLSDCQWTIISKAQSPQSLDMPPDSLLAIVVDANISGALVTARSLARTFEGVPLLLVTQSDAREDLQKVVATDPVLAARVEILSDSMNDLRRALHETIRIAKIQRKTRTTLDRINTQVRSARAIDRKEQRRLIISDRYLASILEHAQEAILSVNEEGIVTSCNQKALDLFRTRQIEGHPVGAMPIGDAARVLKRLLSGLDPKSEAQESELVALTPDNTLNFWEVNIAPIRGNHGELLGRSLIVRDRTEKKRLQLWLEAEQKVTRLLAQATRLESNASEILKIICGALQASVGQLWLLREDASELHLAISFKEASLPSAAPEEAPCGAQEMKGLAERARAERAPVLISNMQRTASTPAVGSRVKARNFSGLAFPIYADQEFYGVVQLFTRYQLVAERALLESIAAFGRDMGQSIRRIRAEEALQQAQEKLRQHAGELEIRVAERTARLRETIAELETFSYSVSHDLRAPLRAIASFSQLLSEEYADGLDPGAHHYLKRIQGAAKRMDQLTLDLLSYAQITRTDLPRQEVDLEKLIDDLVQERIQLQEPHAKVVVERPIPNACSNLPVLSQSIANLLENAAKFAKPNVQPLITIRAETRGADVRLWIEDNGIGISPAHHHRIFGAFERLDSTGKLAGTGIGLAIVRRTMERIGGSFGVESELGQGSRFWIQVKRVPERNAPSRS